jgi:hypothetical protein
MEPTPSSVSKDKLEEQLGKMEDWYKALIFDSSCKVLASKNVPKVDEKELRLD